MGAFSLDELKKEKKNKTKTTLRYHLSRFIGLIYYSRREEIKVTLEIRVPFELHTEVIQ